MYNMTFIKDIHKFQAPQPGNVHVIQPGQFLDIDDKYYKPNKKVKSHMRTGKLQPANETVNYTFQGFSQKTTSLNKPSFKNYGSYFYNPVTGFDQAHK